MSEDRIFETQDGSHSILSHQFGVSYHSKYGAITESKHVFLEAGLFPKLLGKDRVSVLEIGFGTGLNALLTLIESEQKKINIYYETIEGYPISAEQFEALNYAEILNLPEKAKVFKQMHTSNWGNIHQLGPNFQFKKVKQLFEEINLDSKFDVIYFDAFAPSAQPELWEEPLLQKMYDALNPEGFIVTYCAKGIVKRRLKAIGFLIERLPGPPGKREMTRGVKPK